MNTNTGNRIKNAAEAVGLICGIGAVLLGVSYWVTLRSWIGFLLFVVVAGFGIFFAWLWKIVISGFGELVANSGEGITLLRKLSENINVSTPEAETIDEGLSILEEAELAVMPENKQKKMMKQRNSNINNNQESEFPEEPLEFCFYCGADLKGNQTACPSCGGKLK